MLVVLFGAVLLTDQVVSYNYIKKLDANYSKIVTKNTSIISALQTITHESSNIHRCVLSIAALEPEKYSLLQSKITDSRQKIDSYFVKLESFTTAPTEVAAVNELKETYIQYKTQYGALLPLLVSENFVGTHQNERLEKLHNTYGIYLTMEERQIAFFRERAEKESVELSDSSGKTSAMLLLIGTLPYLLLICGLIISFVAILWLDNKAKWPRNLD